MREINQPIVDRWQIIKNRKYGVAIFNYHDSEKFSLDLEIGDCVIVIEEYSDLWYRGFCTKNRSLIGIFPANFIAIKPHKVENEGLFESVTLLEDSVCREVVKCLRDWHLIWKSDLYLKNKVKLFEKITSTINDLIKWRKQLITATLTQDQIKEIKSKITQHIDMVNRQLELDLVPRKNGKIVDPELISPIELYQIHHHSSSIMSVNQRTSNISSNSNNFSIISNFLYLHLRDISLPSTVAEDDFEFHFSVFDYSLSHHLTEKFVAKVGLNRGDVSNLNLSTVFIDLGTIQASNELYLQIQALRFGKMLIVESKSSKTFSSSATLPSSLNSNTSMARFKRPFGSAIINLSDLIRSEILDKIEMSVKLSTCSNESDFFQIHDMLYKKQSNKLTQLQNSSISLSLKILTGSDSEKLIKDNPLTFKNVSCLTSKKGFPDIIMPGDVRNDLYLVLDSGEFEKGGKSIPKNIEASISLLGSDGLPIKNSISYGSGVEPLSKYNSLVLYHSNNPKWSEIVKISIPLEVFDLKAHLRIEFRHCSTKDNNSNKEKDKNFLGFSFIPLSDEQGTIIKDQSHELYIYKSQDLSEVRNKLNDPSLYLRQAYGPKDYRSNLHHDNFNLIRSSKESVHIRTLLCSTKLTQNGDLLSLLKWRANPETVHEALNKVRRLNGEEVVKFLQDILDALFSMFSTHDGNQTNHSNLVFEVLLHILSLLDDPKYEHFKPVLNTYISGHFAAALVYKGLLICLKQYTEFIKDCDSQTNIQMCFRSLEWIFKFIVQSRILYARATGDHLNEDIFKQEIFTLFNSFNKMLSINYEPSLVPSQVAFLKSFSSTYNQLLQILVPDELTRIIKLIMNCLLLHEPCLEIVSAKLRCIYETIKNETLLRDFKARRELIEVFSRHLLTHINRQHELKFCTKIISELLIFLHNEKINIASGKVLTMITGSIATISSEVEILVLNLFEPLVRVIVELSTSTSGSINSSSMILLHSYVSSFITLLRLMDETHFNHLLKSKNRKEKKELLLQVFYVFKQIFQPEMYNKDWSVMKMTTNHIILCSLHELSLSLINDFLGDGKTSPVNTFDIPLWNSFFNLSVSFLTQNSLQLENFPNSKKEAILEKYQDMRVLMGFLMLSMWEKLGDHKVHFIPSMVAPFLEVTLVPEKELRKATLPIFYDMIDAEFKSDGSFKQVESKLINKLDILVSENRGDDEFKQLFNAILLEKVNQQNPIWKEQGIQMIHSITKLLELLLDYRYVINGEENRDKRMSCTVNLLNFYKDEINRKEMYVRYIYKLCDLHIPAENYTEAAFTLKLHADLLSWSFNVMCRDSYCPLEQQEWQRKEALYLAIIDYFDKGKCWEEGIPLIEEMAHFYRTKIFDYQKLSSLLRKEAEFLDNIRTQLRPESEYFRVGFYGKGFPIFLRNKVFVYRGLEYEKIGAFTARLQTEFPQSQILTKNNSPEARILESDEQYIQICNVKPVPESRQEFEGFEVPEKIMVYYLVNDVKRFTFDRPIHKGPIDKENEFKSLWIERTVLRINGKLPGILRWFEVKEKPLINELSPVEHACDTIENMNKELQKLISSYTLEPTKALSPLTMRLQGVIEAAVNGGINKYQDAFFDPNYIHNNSQHLLHIKRMKQLILQQVRILEGGLSLHGRLVPANVQPLHKRLVERFTIMRHSVLEKSSFVVDYQRIGEDFGRKASIINTPLPPIPNDVQPYVTSVSPYQSLLPRNEDDQIYSVPQDYSGTPPIPDRNSQTPPPPIPRSRPRSAGYSANNIANDTTTVTPKLISMPTSINNGSSLIQRSRSIPRSHHLHNYQPQHSTFNLSPNKAILNFQNNDNVPPLPPRNSNANERLRPLVVPIISNPGNSNVDEKVKPVLPKRSHKRSPSMSTVHTQENIPVLISIDIDQNEQSSRYQPPPLPNKRIPSSTIITIGPNLSTNHHPNSLNSSENFSLKSSYNSISPLSVPNCTLTTDGFPNLPSNGETFTRTITSSDQLSESFDSQIFTPEASLDFSQLETSINKRKGSKINDSLLV